MWAKHEGRLLFGDMGSVGDDFFTKGYLTTGLQLAAKRKLLPDLTGTASLIRSNADGSGVFNLELRGGGPPPCGLHWAVGLSTIGANTNKGQGLERFLQTGRLDVEVGRETDESSFGLGLKAARDPSSSGALSASVILGYKECVGGEPFGIFAGWTGTLKETSLVTGIGGKDWFLQGGYDMESHSRSVCGVVQPIHGLTVGVRGKMEEGKSNMTHVSWDVGAKMDYGSGATVGLKVDATKNITMSTELKVTEAATLTLAAQVNTSDGSGKFGVGVHVG